MHQISIKSWTFSVSSCIKRPTILSKYLSLENSKDVDEYDFIDSYAHQIKPQPM